MSATHTAAVPKQQLARVDTSDLKGTEEAAKDVLKAIEELGELTSPGAIGERGDNKKVVIEVGAAGAAAFVLVAIATTVVVLRYGCNLCLQPCR
ncbi:hypothetical protein QBC34DRAFT_373971 [Podospora aff. communis PSN243]|uniref:Uncharacterized protein n=1 Tax=Podospora aff. communis PSN243 TaxID=3040156 RepID=A0AAV9H712_9PEZI|nr:hypothetical protein QBC34DRAFT_373971 [Podospora aff. communis PSN243]